MVRPTARQDFDAPYQMRHLPKETPTLEAPVPTPSIVADYGTTLATVLGFGLVAAVMLFIEAFISTPLAELRNYAFFVIACYLAGRVVRARFHPKTLIWFAILGVVFLISAEVRVVELRLLLAIASLAFVSTAFSRHYLYLWSATIGDHERRAQVRSDWDKQAAWHGVVASVLTLLPIYVLFVTLAPVKALLALIPFIVFACIQFGPYGFRIPRAIRSGIRAIVRWYTYNEGESKLPGHFSSEYGTCAQRKAMSGIAIVIIAAFLGSCIQNFFFDPELLREAAMQMENTIEVEPEIPSEFSDTLVHLERKSTNHRYVFYTALLFCSPVLTCFTSCILAAAPVLLRPAELRVKPLELREGIEEQVRTSPVQTERESIFLGHLPNATPALIHYEAFDEHAAIYGGSGSNKTSLFFCPFIEEIGARKRRDGRQTSIIVIDLKGDSNELFASLGVAKNRMGELYNKDIPIKWFTSELGKSTYTFSLFHQPFWKNITRAQKTELVLGALNLIFSAKFGESWYSDANYAVLEYVFEEFEDVSSWKELAERTRYLITNGKRERLHSEIRRSGTHLPIVLSRLADVEAINAQGLEPDSNVMQNAIDLTQYYTTPSLLYVQLPSSLGLQTAGDLSRMFVFSLMAAAKSLGPDGRTCQLFVAIDEFQRSLGKSLAYTLETGRSLNTSFVLGTQTLEGIRTESPEIASQLETNIRYSQFFGVESMGDQDRIIALSGLGVDIEQAFTTNAEDYTSVTTREVVIPRFNRSDLLLTTDDPRLSIVKLTRGAGYAQWGGMPVRVAADYHISKTEYESRRRMSWPAPTAGTITPKLAPSQKHTPEKKKPRSNIRRRSRRTGSEQDA